MDSNLLPETSDTRAKLAGAIQQLQAKGDTNSIAQLVNAYKTKYQTAQPSSNLGQVAAQETLAGAQKSGSAITEGASKFAALPVVQPGSKTPVLEAAGNVAKRTGTLLETGLGTAAGAVRSIFAPLTAIFQKAGSTAANATGIHPLDAMANSPIGQKLDSWAQAHPEAAKNLMDAVTVAGGALGDTGGIKNLLNTDVNAGAKAAVDTIKAVPGQVSEVAGGVKTINSVANATVDAKAMDSLAGQIVQGKAGDIIKAKAALSTLDTTGVKTYQDLSKVLGEKISNLSSKLDTTLETKNEVKPASDLVLKSKVGDSTVAHNYVADAISQLKSHYQATNDVNALAKVTQLEEKANTTGLTIKEINDLAKEHGQAINAFNANGQAASGLSKQAAENTRTGLKSTARELFGDPLYKTADQTISSLINTKSLIDDMAEKVGQLSQKIKTRTLGERAGRLAGQVVNTLGLNTPKGLVEYFLGRGTGLKTLNALDLQATLQKNLKSLQEILSQNASDATIESELQKIIDAAKK